MFNVTPYYSDDDNNKINSMVEIKVTRSKSKPKPKPNALTIIKNLESNIHKLSQSELTTLVSFFKKQLSDKNGLSKNTIHPAIKKYSLWMMLCLYQAQAKNIKLNEQEQQHVDGLREAIFNDTNIKKRRNGYAKDMVIVDKNSLYVLVSTDGDSFIICEESYFIQKVLGLEECKENSKWKTNMLMYKNDHTKIPYRIVRFGYWYDGLLEKYPDLFKKRYNDANARPIKCFNQLVDIIFSGSNDNEKCESEGNDYGKAIKAIKAIKAEFKQGGKAAYSYNLNPRKNLNGNQYVVKLNNDITSFLEPSGKDNSYKVPEKAVTKIAQIFDCEKKEEKKACLFKCLAMVLVKLSGESYFGDTDESCQPLRRLASIFLEKAIDISGQQAKKKNKLIEYKNLLSDASECVDTTVEKIKGSLSFDELKLLPIAWR